MTFTVETLAKSLASFLTTLSPFEGVTFYQNPTQQQKVPCIFLQQRYSNIKPEPSGQFIRTIGIALTFLVDYNLPNLQQIYQKAAETLDFVLETFPYTDNEATTILRTYDRNWTIDEDSLTYKFELRIRQRKEDSANPMETLKSEVSVENG